MKLIKESGYTDRINALKGKLDARSQRDSDRQSTEIIKLRQELENTKNDFLIKYNKFLSIEVPYVKEAFEILNSLSDAGIEDFPNWFFYTSGYNFGIINDYDPYCGLFTSDALTGVDITNENDPYFVFEGIGLEISNLEKIDFIKDGSYDAFGFEPVVEDWWDKIGELKSGIELYSAVLKDMSYYTAERKKWFEKVDNWLTEMENGVDSDLDGDGKIGEQKRAKQVVNKILEGADVRSALSALEMTEERVKYWLDMNGDNYELNTVGENDTVEAGRLSDLGIGENDPMYQDKLDKHFEVKLGIKPEEWVVG